MKEEEKFIVVDFDDINSIKKAEKIKSEYENRGYMLVGTTRKGFNRFQMKYEKIKKVI